MNKAFNTRSATEFVQRASLFRSDINIIKNTRTAAAKSIMGVMCLAIKKGDGVTLHVEGQDEQEAITSLGDFLKGKGSNGN